MKWKDWQKLSVEDRNEYKELFPDFIDIGEKLSRQNNLIGNHLMKYLAGMISIAVAQICLIFGVAQFVNMCDISSEGIYKFMSYSSKAMIIFTIVMGVIIFLQFITFQHIFYQAKKREKEWLIQKQKQKQTE